MPSLLKNTSLLLLSLSLLSACAAVKRSQPLVDHLCPEIADTLQHYQLAEHAPAGYGQLQYEDLQGHFATQASPRSMKLADLDDSQRQALPGGFNCQKRTWFLLSLGLAPSTCHYEKEYHLDIADLEAGVSRRQTLRFKESRTIGWVAPLMWLLPAWQIDTSKTDTYATYTLFEMAATH